jgi:septum formation protein
LWFNPAMTRAVRQTSSVPRDVAAVPGLYAGSVVLASRSPRRRELLGAIVGADRLSVLPPRSAAEQGFDGLATDDAIMTRQQRITRRKHAAVRRQLATLPDAGRASPLWLVAADTIVIARTESEAPLVLGQPDESQWRRQVRHWMRRYLSGREHEVRTAAIVSRERGGAVESIEFTVSTTVEFADISAAELDWYIATAESCGKAGGYAIQGHAAAFVTSVRGSLTNVIGLPVQEVREALGRLGWSP